MAEINNEKAINESLGNSNSSFSIKKFLFDNMVTTLFVILCIGGAIASKLPIFFITNELLIRITRNSFLVLALIIPVLAGMGLNFSIVIGAMAAQIAIIIVTHLGITGILGFLSCAILSVPFAIVFGILIGKLLNKTKGQEMIASMITGFFANGLYQLLFLFLVGTLIPMKNKVLMLSSGIGVRNTIDLKAIMYSLDKIWKVPVSKVLILSGLVIIAYGCYKLYIGNKNDFKQISKVKQIVISISGVVLLLIGFMFTYPSVLPKNLKILANLKLPVVTAAAVVVLCIFNVVIVKTKLGQDFRTVGQDKHIASVSGINVNRTRLIAITISTVLAAWGQLIFLQNLGTLNTYGSHVQIATFAIAAILIGGASVSKATIGQALLGVILFHTLFIVSPKAAKELFGDAQIGEFFRNFLAYGVIGVSLGLHAWKKTLQTMKK
ncbi:ABC transporter permease subunit [Wukongibacter sp. M2B1]|uniref:ABC transporter permease subunit n=1 Tax=Wukongibacter sp. M2B1 TaxID=3088895 RepID=UPI003D7B4B25